MEEEVRRRAGRRRRWKRRKRWDQESEKLETSLVPNTLWDTDGQDFKS